MVKHIELRRDVGLFERREVRRGKWGRGGIENAGEGSKERERERVRSYH